MTAAPRQNRLLHPTPERAGLEVRLAHNAAEIDAAQALRYRVFYEEMKAHPTPEAAASRRDTDRYDDHCDHLLIIDRAESGEERVIGTYRLLRRSRAARAGGFYTESEFDIAPLLAQPGEILELGRSCVDPAHRTGAVMTRLWRGIADYAMRHEITLMFGCASFPGTDPSAHAATLSYLYHNHLAPPELRARPLPHRHVEMNLLPPEAGDAESVAAMLDNGGTVAPLPPLIKGYLRLGGFVGDGAVIDEAFNTTDVCVIVPTGRVTAKYLRHYLAPHAG